jgi:hypothetical protein
MAAGKNPLRRAKGALEAIKTAYKVLKSASLLTGALAKVLPSLMRIWSEVEPEPEAIPMLDLEVVENG